MPHDPHDTPPAHYPLFDLPEPPAAGGTLSVLSYGGGQDSSAILLKLLHDRAYRARYAPNDLLVVMSDTGDEWRETYEHVERMRALCRKAGVPFAFLEAGGEHHAETWPSLTGFYDRTSTVGSKAFPKTCTSRLKLEPIYRFLSDHVRVAYGCSGRHSRWARAKAPLIEFAVRYGRIRVLLGIAAGEEKRRAKREKQPKWMRSAIEFAYPLIDEGLDREACQTLIRELGYEVPIPSNCMRCPFMDERELLHLMHARPDVLEDWKRQERAKLARFADKPARKNLGVWGKTVKDAATGEERPMTLDDVLEQALEQWGHLTPEELAEHRFSHGHCVTSSW